MAQACTAIAEEHAPTLLDLLIGLPAQLQGDILHRLKDTSTWRAMRLSSRAAYNFVNSHVVALTLSRLGATPEHAAQQGVRACARV
jgi:hypothetical protein